MSVFDKLLTVYLLLWVFGKIFFIASFQEENLTLGWLGNETLLLFFLWIFFGTEGFFSKITSGIVFLKKWLVLFLIFDLFFFYFDLDFFWGF